MNACYNLQVQYGLDLASKKLQYEYGVIRSISVGQATTGNWEKITKGAVSGNHRGLYGWNHLD